MKGTNFELKKKLKEEGMEDKVIRGYKGFDKDLRCRGFQYEVGKEYEHEGQVKCCESGFHFCENALDVLRYYDPAMSRYCVVEGSGVVDEGTEDSKLCAGKLKVVKEIGLREMIDEAVAGIMKGVDWENDKEYNKEDYPVVMRKGDYYAATSTGVRSAATTTGDKSAAVAIGIQSFAMVAGFYSAAMATGFKPAAMATGFKSAATAMGNKSTAINTGANSVASVEGKESIAIVTGKDSVAKGAMGCWLVLTERGEWNGETCPIKEVRAVKVDGVTVMPDTYYGLKNGEIVKIE